MYHPTNLDLVRLHQQELIAEAERARTARALRATRRVRRRRLRRPATALIPAVTT